MRRVFDLINRNLSLSKLSQFIKKDKITKDLPLITISREKGSGGSIIARHVVGKLGRSWKVYHKEIIDDIARESHLEKELIKELDESKISLIDEVVADFFGRRYVSLNSYYKHLVKVLSVIGHRGRAVIVGRGANFLFPHALKIRVIADPKDRIKTLVKYQKLSPRAAEKLIEESDRKRKEFVQMLFQRDHSKQPHHFDLVIQTGQNMSIDQAADLIVSLAKKRFRIR